jgi:CheY-like chemotaxis protein
MHNTKTTKTFSWDNKVVLIAEDQKINFVLLKAIFDKAKATVIWAKDGEEAVESFLNSEHIDLVIMDYMMPKLNGIEATRRIKEKRQNTPVIFHSANTFEEDELNAIAYDDVVYFQKPVNPKKLMNKAEDMLRE